MTLWEAWKYYTLRVCWASAHEDHILTYAEARMGFSIDWTNYVYGRD